MGSPGAAEPSITRTRGALALVDVPARLPEEVRLTENTRPAIVPLASPTPSLEPDLDTWRSIIDRLRVARPALASIFEHAMLIEVRPERLVIGFEPGASFLADRAGEPEGLEQLTAAVRAHFGVPTQVELRTSAQAEHGVRTVANVDAQLRNAEIEKARAAIEAHPLVQDAMRLFGAQLRDVKLPSGDG
jgi:hypothetical protein